MIARSSFLFALLIALACSAAQKEQKPLTPGQRALADSLNAAFVLPQCGASIAATAAAKTDCLLAPHLRAFTEWLAVVEPDHAKAADQLGKRYRTLCAADSARIDASGMQAAGDNAAPIRVVVFISALCPLCRYVSSEVHAAVTSGQLKGKASIVAKPFTGSICDAGLMAANRQGRFWEFLSGLVGYTKRLDEKDLLHVADSLKLDTLAFRTSLHDSSVTASLRQFRSEGVALGVKLTPTVFINGRRYESYKDPEWVIDAIDYRYETATQPARR